MDEQVVRRRRKSIARWNGLALAVGSLPMFWIGIFEIPQLRQRWDLGAIYFALVTSWLVAGILGWRWGCRP